MSEKHVRKSPLFRVKKIWFDLNKFWSVLCVSLIFFLFTIISIQLSVENESAINSSDTAASKSAEPNCTVVPHIFRPRLRRKTCLSCGVHLYIVYVSNMKIYIGAVSFPVAVQLLLTSQIRTGIQQTTVAYISYYFDKLYWTIWRQVSRCDVANSCKCILYHWHIMLLPWSWKSLKLHL